MMTKTYARVSETAGLEWHQMPQDGGQHVSVTYAESDGRLYCRRHDRSDNTVSISYETIDDTAEDDAIRFEPWNGILPATTGDEVDVHDDTLADIADVLNSRGAKYAGANAIDSAGDWIDAGITDPDVVDEWCDVGVWEPTVAARLIDAGLSPDAVEAGAQSMVDDLAHPDDAAEEWTDGDPIYSVCNNDTSIDDLIAACSQTYVCKTDGFEYEDQAKSLDEFIELAFRGEGLGKITDLASLEKKFQKYVDDGGWCWIEVNGKRVVEIGEC